MASIVTALPKDPLEEDFCLTLRNGLILCNVLDKVNPGAVFKVMKNPIITVQSTEAAAQSAIQSFENMKNFLVAVKAMKLLTYEASDLEKGGSSSKVVDCILCLKGYYEALTYCTKCHISAEHHYCLDKLLEKLS